MSAANPPSRENATLTLAPLPGKATALARWLDGIAPRVALSVGIGGGVLLGVPLVWTGHWLALVGIAGLLGAASWLTQTGEAVAVHMGPSELLEPPTAPQPVTPAPPRPLLEMIAVPGGAFVMGSHPGDPGAYSDEHPRHRVTVTRFLMAKVPVTQQQYQAVMGINPSEPQGEQLPVNQVSWNDAVAFCNRLSEREGLRPCYHKQGTDWQWDQTASGYRLPTEAEWEYAARAGSEGAWCCGDDEAQLTKYAWYEGNSQGKLQPVGTREPNQWGLHDLHGNVWEWCWDFSAAYGVESARDPAGARMGSARVLRGGSFGNESRNLRSASRDRFLPELGVRVFGFRCVRAGAGQP